MRDTQVAGGAQGMVPGLIPVAHGIPIHFSLLIPCRGRLVIPASSLVRQQSNDKWIAVYILKIDEIFVALVGISVPCY